MAVSGRKARIYALEPASGRIGQAGGQGRSKTRGDLAGKTDAVS